LYNGAALSTKSKEEIFETMSAQQENGSNLRPIGDRVAVRRLTDEEMGTKSASGIIIPDTVSKEKPEQGIVIAVGPGKWDEDGEKRIPMDVKVGDRVVFSKYGYDEVKLGTDEYFLVSASSILAVIS